MNNKRKQINIPLTTAKTIASQHMADRNPDRWDGTGTAPASFNTNATNHCLQGDIRIDIAFKYDENEKRWACCCSSVYEPDNEILETRIVWNIRSEKDLANELDFIIRTSPSTTARTIAHQHMEKKNPHHWNGIGTMPRHFDCSPTSYALKDDIRIDLMFAPCKTKYSTNRDWVCGCYAVYEPNNSVLTALNATDISSEEDLAITINALICDVTL